MCEGGAGCANQGAEEAGGAGAGREGALGERAGEYAEGVRAAEG